LHEKHKYKFVELSKERQPLKNKCVYKLKFEKGKTNTLYKT